MFSQGNGNIGQKGTGNLEVVSRERKGVFRGNAVLHRNEPPEEAKDAGPVL